MPKNKKESSSDSSDTDVRDSPPPKKKSKNDGNSSGFSGDRANGETTWNLSGNKMVKVRNFRGKNYVDIREYYEKNGELLPGKKGISLTPDLYQKFKAILKEIDEELLRI